MSDICWKLNFTQCHIAVALWRIVPPLFLIIGIPGNILSIAVLSRQRLNKTATSVYLRLLAVVDTTVLLINIPRHLVHFYSTVELMNINTFVCKAVRFLSPGAITMAWWLLPIISIDRLILVRHPVWAKIHCTKKLAVVIFTIFALVTLAMHFHSVLFMDIVRNEVTISRNLTNATVKVDETCSPSPDWYREFHVKMWPFILLIVVNIAPVSCQIICNVLLVRELVKRSSKKQNQRALQDGNDRDQPDLRSVTRMLVVVCIFFVMSSLPKCLHICLDAYIFKPKSPQNHAKKMLLGALSQQLVYCSNTFNFLLYILSGRVFRRELWSMCDQGKRRVMQCLGRNAV